MKGNLSCLIAGHEGIDCGCFKHRPPYRKEPFVSPGMFKYEMEGDGRDFIVNWYTNLYEELRQSKAQNESWQRNFCKVVEAKDVIVAQRDHLQYQLMGKQHFIIGLQSEIERLERKLKENGLSVEPDWKKGENEQ